MEGISYFDLALAVLLLIFGIKGLLRGFIKEVFGLVGIVGGIFIASRYAEDVGNLIDTHLYHIANRASIYFIGFLVALLIFWILSIALGAILTKVFSMSGLGLVNRLFGFIAGSLKIFLLFSIVVFALRSMEIFKDIIDKKLSNSYSYPYLIKSGNYIVKLNINKEKEKLKSISKNILTDSNDSKKIK